MSMAIKNPKKKDGLFSLKIRKDKVNSAIRNYGYLGMILVILTMSFTLLGLMPSDIDPFVVMFLSILLLAFILGIFQKSRFCAVAFMAYYIFDTIITIVYFFSGELAIGTLVSMIFIRIFLLFCFYRGTKAVYVYHKFIKGRPALEKIQK
jgi:hypothetical protein